MRRVVIIGGGAIGSAIAYFLNADPKEKAFDVTVVERDFSYTQASSALSASSIRQQFSTAINIEMSLYGISFFRTLGQTLRVGDNVPDIGLVEPGYLYLASPAGVEVLRENHAMQKAHAVDVALMTPDELQARFPWMSTEGVALASLGLSGEGWYDGYSLLQAFRKKAVSQGTRYVQAHATGLQRNGAAVTGVQIDSGATLPADIVVNAAGAWAAKVAAWAGIDLPVHGRRRSVFSFSCPDKLPGCPLVIDTSGIWLRPEGRKFICGFAPPATRDLDDQPLEVEHEVFERFIWPALAARVPAFEAIRMTGAWAGYYEMNVFDHNAILGLHPACDNLYFANGFSGHGLQQCPAAGRGVAELVRFGGYRSLDLSALSFARILENRPLLEKNVI
ncbi:FAD-binding oxidoreductase [Variovorax sp. J22G73]|jgi:glycine/D-amino acid oxidase-like deaminating enzyme|uniref:NAD(P)/FAD-dependent oxidoreductase n=1 Tax=unclassified Variovorax TaxID=663243 RepID=UPI000D5C9EA2|nr:MULTISPECIES: FAD-binding oxidoreductase [unclassified Variovorax]MDM0006348.1 FAD-binding oxidoreductase [Variovorax sp. J22R203]MDM0097629.1 FAD-binding oxidoreductase [Variovorax sp. J22G73]